ncbi:glycosyl hydrolase family 28-related protein [Aerococcus urinaeequi]|uniref:glycosyl hydrolase family 28-related protein n=1 Tax=Aerococcus urinaeequi TaxID=51665 RepID=UPI00366A5F02
MDWNNINTDRDASGLGPIEYDQSKVPSLIRKHADNVRGKTYGQQVREAQARNAEYAGLVASESMSIATNADTLSKDTQNRFKDQIEGTTNSDEVIDARRPFGSETAFKTVGERLDYADKITTDVCINVRLFGAIGDGITDDTIAIQKAIDYVRNRGGGTVFIPSGIFIANLTIYSNVHLKGSSVDNTILKSKPNSNEDVIKSYEFETYTGTTADVVDEGVRFVTISEITVDGNKSQNTSGRGIAIWGAYLNFENVIVQNAADDGIWTEFTSILTPTQQTVRQSALESVFRNIKVFYCDGNAWTYNGPHDSLIDNYVPIGNAGWALYQRDFNSFLTGENWNAWKNGNGFYIGTGLAGHDIVADNDGTGIGMEFKATGGNSRIVNGRFSGWEKGVILRGQAQKINVYVQNCGHLTDGASVIVESLSLSKLDLIAVNNNVALDVISEVSKNFYDVTASVPSGKTLQRGVALRSDSYAQINSGATGYMQLPENNLKVRGWSYTFPQNNGMLLTDQSAPTSTTRGGIKTQNALPDLTSAPTAGEFNTLLSRLRAAGIIGK